MALTHAQRQRATRQEALREQLKASGLLTQYLENVGEIKKLDEHDEVFKNKLDKLKVTNDNLARLINKCLPDEKDINISGDVEHSGSLQITWQK
jgi:hypothetical protein